MSRQPDSPGRLYYSIGEVARMFDVNASLIRFWDKEFDIIKPKKNKKGNRMFSPSDLENIKLIFHLVKEKGYTLEGAKKVLKGDRDKAIRDAEIMESLRSMRAFLLKLRDEI